MTTRSTQLVYVANLPGNTTSVLFTVGPEEVVIVKYLTMVSGAGTPGNIQFLLDNGSGYRVTLLIFNLTTDIQARGEETWVVLMPGQQLLVQPSMDFAHVTVSGAALPPHPEAG